SCSSRLLSCVRLVLLCSSVIPAFVALIVLFTSFFPHLSSSTFVYSLSLHDALPILISGGSGAAGGGRCAPGAARWGLRCAPRPRSEEHTSELQSREKLVCRLLLEKKTNILNILRNNSAESCIGDDFCRSC